MYGSCSSSPHVITYVCVVADAVIQEVLMFCESSLIQTTTATKTRHQSTRIYVNHHTPDMPGLLSLSLVPAPVRSGFAGCNLRNGAP